MELPDDDRAPTETSEIGYGPTRTFFFLTRLDRQLQRGVTQSYQMPGAGNLAAAPPVEIETDEMITAGPEGQLHRGGVQDDPVPHGYRPGELIVIQSLMNSAADLDLDLGCTRTAGTDGYDRTFLFLNHFFHHIPYISGGRPAGTPPCPTPPKLPRAGPSVRATYFSAWHPRRSRKERKRFPSITPEMDTLSPIRLSIKPRKRNNRRPPGGSMSKA